MKTIIMQLSRHHIKSHNLKIDILCSTNNQALIPEGLYGRPIGLESSRSGSQGNLDLNSIEFLSLKMSRSLGWRENKNDIVKGTLVAKYFYILSRELDRCVHVNS